MILAFYLSKHGENELICNFISFQLYGVLWWYKSCHQSHLNRLYLNGSHVSNADGVNLLSFRGHRCSLKRTEIKVKTKAWDNVYPRIKRQSNQGFNNPPKQHTGIWMLFFPGSGELEPFLGGWAIWTGSVKFLQRNAHVLSFNMELFHFREQMAEKKRSSRKLQSLILPFIKEIDHQIRLFSKAFEHNFGPGGRGFEGANL